MLLAEPWRPRRGVNAARATVPFGEANDLAAVIASNDALTELRAATRVRLNYGGTDFALVTAWRGDTEAALLGMDLRGTFGVGWWIEAAYLLGDGAHEEISGHMLRQGMMGSDISYEDLMTARDMRSPYHATVVGDSVVDGRPCWKLELKAKDDTVTSQDLYALSGMRLKTWTMSEVKEFPGGRKFPTKMSVQDHVRKDSITRIEFEELEFGIEFPREVFSLRWLERR